MPPSRRRWRRNAPPGASGSSETLHRLDALGLPVRAPLPEAAGGIDALGRPHVARALVAAGHASSVDDAFLRATSSRVDPRMCGASAWTRATAIAEHRCGRRHRGPRPRTVGAANPVVSTSSSTGASAAWRPTTRAGMSHRPGGGSLRRARGLLATGGSDYHGDRGDYAAAQALVHVPPEVGTALLGALEGRRCEGPNRSVHPTARPAREPSLDDYPPPDVSGGASEAAASTASGSMVSSAAGWSALASWRCSAASRRSVMSVMS